MFPAEESSIHHVELASSIVSAFVSKNPLPRADLPALITSVHAALQGLGKAEASELTKPIPPVPLKKSVTTDHLISLEDGRQYRSLKLHLRARGLTAEQYREKWGLPHDYPMVAPAYSAKRSEVARSIGLGQKRKKVQRKP